MQQIASILCQMILSTIHFTAHMPALKSLHSVGPRMNSSWAAAASDPSEECMVTVSTLERQHMASWSSTASTSNRATLSSGSHKRPGTDPSLNRHKPANSTEKREHCECPSSSSMCSYRSQSGQVQNYSLLWQRNVIGVPNPNAWLEIEDSKTGPDKLMQHFLPALSSPLPLVIYTASRKKNINAKQST